MSHTDLGVYAFRTLTWESMHVARGLGVTRVAPGLGVTLVAHGIGVQTLHMVECGPCRVGGHMWIRTLCMSHVDLEVYVRRMRTWSEFECEGRVLALYIWSEADHVECGRSYTSGICVGVD